MSYDPKKDYAAAIARYIAYGDYKNAAAAEQQRNAKIEGEGMTQYQQTFDYADYLPGGAKYTPDSGELLKAYTDRPDFSYDPAGDALYGQYKKMYIRDGALAMEDAAGQAAALSGGYGSSYAEQVGQQSYNGYLAQLNDLLPELYAQRRSEYEAGSEQLYDRYAAALEREKAQSDAALEREKLRSEEEYRQKTAGESAQKLAWDEAFRLWTELGYAPTEVASVLGIAAGTPTADAAAATGTAAGSSPSGPSHAGTKPQEEPQSEPQEQEENGSAYALCMRMLQAGKLPSDTLLQLAGISQANAKRILEGLSTEV